MPLVGKILSKVAKKATKVAPKSTGRSSAEIAKRSVRVKPAAKTVGNPPNAAKRLEGVASSHYRTWNPFTGMEDGVRSAGKSRDARVANSKKPTGSGNASKPVESKLQPKKKTSSAKLVKPLAAKVPARRPVANPENPPRGTVRINSGSTRPAVLRKRAVAPKKK
jgi:hypothetical protein